MGFEPMTSRLLSGCSANYAKVAWSLECSANSSGGQEEDQLRWLVNLPRTPSCGLQIGATHCHRLSGGMGRSGSPGHSCQCSLRARGSDPRAQFPTAVAQRGGPQYIDGSDALCHQSTGAGASSFRMGTRGWEYHGFPGERNRLRAP